MDVLAFIAMLIAAIIFLFVPDARLTRFGGRTHLSLGLFFLTLGLIFQFTGISHPMHL